MDHARVVDEVIKLMEGPDRTDTDTSGVEYALEKLTEAARLCEDAGEILGDLPWDRLEETKIADAAVATSECRDALKRIVEDGCEGISDD